MLILQLKPDFVFSSITHVNLLMGIFIPFIRPLCKKTKFITREVNIPSIRAKHIATSKKMDFFYRRFIKNFDCIIAQSKFMKQDIHLNYDVNKEKIVVINNPIDIETIHHALKQNIDDNELFKSDKVNILAVGNLRRQKGFDILLKAMVLLSDKFHLFILGEGKERKLIETMVKDLELLQKVTLLGFKKNPYIYMKKSDIFVLSSRYEGFPNVILEANACGKFVIAFECPGVNNEIIEVGVNGVLVENGNYKELAEEIEKHIDRRVDKNMIQKIVERYKVEKIVKNYEKIFL
jgi:glycosyltransferase involved in cell wall biosynthesis